jgi:hypothetical protein
MAVKPHGLANRPGEPYPATFRIQWTHRESNSDLRDARAVSSRWTMSPFSGPAGESNPDLLVASQASSRWTSRPCLQQRSVWELNPVFRLTTAACSHSTYRPIEGSDPGWNRTITFLDVAQASSPLDHGIKSVTEVGVEPTQSQVLGLLALPVCVPGQSSSGSGGRTRRAELMKLCWALAHPRHQVTKGRLELPSP